MTSAAAVIDYRPGAGPARFGFIALILAMAAAMVAALTPLPFAIAIVFLFAGPHNWVEARYVLARLPSRWGPLRGYFITGAAGVLLLSASSIALPGVARLTGGTGAGTPAMLWNLALVGWIAALATMRSRQKPVRDWWWIVPIACFTGAVVSWQPWLWSLLLVYLHPVMALWVLDRELRAHHREWRRPYRFVLAILPFLLLALWWHLHDAPPLPGDGTDALTMRIITQAGGTALASMSSHFLVAAHAFLELLHYAVWIVAIPTVALRAVPWRMDRMPLASRSDRWRKVLRSGLVASAFAVAALWLAFAIDYTTTRDIYFTLAIVHVLAEVPLLIRLL